MSQKTETRCPFSVEGIQCNFVTSDMLEYINHKEIHERAIISELNVLDCVNHMVVECKDGRVCLLCGKSEDI